MTWLSYQEVEVMMVEFQMKICQGNDCSLWGPKQVFKAKTWSAPYPKQLAFVPKPEEPKEQF